MKTNNSETSLSAYGRNFSNFINRGNQVLEVLTLQGPLTSNEIFEFIKDTFPLSYRHNTHARLSDLRDDGLVFEQSKRECSVTGEYVTVWSVTPQDQISSFQRKALEKKLNNAKLLVSKLEHELSKLNESDKEIK